MQTQELRKPAESLETLMALNMLQDKTIQVIDKVGTEAIRRVVLDEKGFVKELPASEWRKFSWDEVRLFMHEYPIYVLPTTELLDMLEDLTDGLRTIEIGAGTGNIGRHLGIKMTDSYLQQANKVVKMLYEKTQQPVIRYPQDVIKADALTAYRRFKPECILGCYVTHLYRDGMSTGNMYGVDFERLLPLVKRLILVGNKETHWENPIMNVGHMEIDLHGDLITRSADRLGDRIFVWDNRKSS